MHRAQTFTPEPCSGSAERRWAAGALSDDVIGRWCAVSVHARGGRRPVAVSIEICRNNGREGDLLFLAARNQTGRLRATGMIFVPADATMFVVAGWGHTAAVEATEVRLRPLPRPLAALFLLINDPGALRRMAHGVLSGRWRDARHDLRRLAATHTVSNHPRDYQFWIDACECLPEAAEARRHAVSGLVFGDPDTPAFAATARSLAAQNPPVPCLPARAVSNAPGRHPATYLIVLQAGEIMARGAVAGAMTELERLGFPEIAIADHDTIDAAGVRSDPVFSPAPSHALMLSSVPARGPWFVRADLLPEDPAISEAGLWAEPARLATWLTCFRANAQARSVRLPFILSHRGPGTRTPPAPLMDGLINAHLAVLGWRMRVRPQAGEPPGARRLTPMTGARFSPVSIVIPSTLTAPHFPMCLNKLLALTRSPEIEVLIAVGQPGALDQAQLHAAARARIDGRVRVVHAPMPAFNYSAVNNFAAARTRHPLLLLLNDDVAPLDEEWLNHMVAHLDDERVGMVGPRLLYPDATVQHGGVLMGLGGLCDHASRGASRDAGRGVRVALDQEMSAVTGACMLLRRAGFDAVGGLDERYPSAFNDIDLCMRVREAGWSIVYAGGVALTHHELQTYGSHYSGERAGRQALDIARLRARWPEAIAADPFHNPNLSLTPGAEWQPAIRPRTAQWRAVERATAFRAAVSPMTRRPANSVPSTEPAYGS